MDVNGALNPQTAMLSKYKTVMDLSVKGPIQIPMPPAGSGSESVYSASNFPSIHICKQGKRILGLDKLRKPGKHLEQIVLIPGGL